MANRPIITLKKKRVVEVVEVVPAAKPPLGPKATMLLERMQTRFGDKKTFQAPMWSLISLVPKSLWADKYKKKQKRILWFDGTLIKFAKLGYLKRIDKGEKGKRAATYEWLNTKS